MTQQVSDTTGAGLPLFWNFWKPGNVRQLCKGQGKGTKLGKGQGICVVLFFGPAWPVLSRARPGPLPFGKSQAQPGPSLAARR